VSGGWLSGGHGGAAAYPGNNEDDGGVTHSDKRGRKQSDGFRHELSGQRARRGERPAVGRAAAVGTGHGALTGGPLMSVTSELKFTPG
jgi:hypothetical protein